MVDVQKLEKIGMIAMLAIGLTVLWNRSVNADNEIRLELERVKRDYSTCSDRFTKLLVNQTRTYEVVIRENTQVIESVRIKLKNSPNNQ